MVSKGGNLVADWGLDFLSDSVFSASLRTIMIAKSTKNDNVYDYSLT